MRRSSARFPSLSARAALAALVALAVLGAQPGPAVAQAGPGSGTAAIDSAAQNGYYRQPSIRGGTIVFVAEGDLWRVPVSGGDAVRLTTHAEQEADPALSPDGEWLAFTATYEGPREVYVMPVAGGSPRRLTYEGGATVRGWTPDGEILYATQRYATLPQAHLVKLDPETGDREIVPLADAADGAWGADGALYFTRFFPHSSNTKRYVGGQAQDVWKWIGVGIEAEELTGDWEGTNRTPMWHDGRVYFVSDRDDHKNLWSMAPDGSDKRQHTRHVGWDVLEPSLDAGRIVYQLGADLRLYDIAADRDRLVPIRLVSDFDQSRERWLSDPMDYLDGWALDEDGSRLGVVAHGRVFVAPAGESAPRRVFQATRHEGVRYREVLFRPGTDELLVLSDRTGEVEWWRVPETGIGEPEQVTGDGETLRMGGVASPDGRWLVHWDHDRRVWLTDLRSGRTGQIDFAARRGWEEPVWSPDSRWFVYGMPASNSMMQLWLYDTSAGRAWPITSDRYSSVAPAWGPDGAWLYFLSDRNLQSLVRSPWGTRQPEPFFTDEWKVYGLALRPGVDDPFAPATELDAGAPGDDGAPGDGAGGGDVVVEIELAGIATRLVELPIEPGNYSALDQAGGHLYWISRPLGGDGADLVAAAIGPDPEPETVAGDVQGYRLSGDRSRMVVRKNGAFYVVDADGREASLDDDTRVDLSDVRFSIVPREHWRQLFVDSWRLERDYFWDPGMSGVDWRAMREKYEPLVDRVRSRDELRDLQAQMAGELATQHTFVYGGFDRDDDLDIDLGFLGARLEPADAGGWRIARIYRADPDLPDQASPLDRWGTDLREGDILTAINGVDLASVADPGVLLRDRVDEQVRLTLSRDGRTVETVVEPISAGRDADLRYDEWEYTRRRTVEEESGGAIGYVHLRAMSAGNIEEWYREFYPVFDRQGLIIDVRHNRGGNIESWLLEKLMRRIWMYWQPRTGDPYWNMQYAPRGHLVVLVDQHTFSDGETFTKGFRALGLGPVIGTRTAGGGIWLTSSNRLVDRGIMSASELGVYSADGDEWLIENRGVTPDMRVDNRPHATFRGEDAQLQAALDYLRQQIADDPREIPDHPPYPDKSVPENAREGSGGE